VAAALPQIDPAAESVAQAQILAKPEHGFGAIEIEGFGAQQHQVEPLKATTGQGRSWVRCHGCDDAMAAWSGR
jgi:hypothetical protein